MLPRVPAPLPPQPPAARPGPCGRGDAASPPCSVTTPCPQQDPQCSQVNLAAHSAASSSCSDNAGSHASATSRCSHLPLWIPPAPPSSTSACPHPPCLGPASPGASTGISQLPVELLGGIMQAVLGDDEAQQRSPVAQFVGRSWLAAYRFAAYRRVCLDVGAALAQLQQRHAMAQGPAVAELLHGLAARLPYAADVTITGLPLRMGSRGVEGACLLHRQLGELLVAALSGSTRLRRLHLDWLPHHLPLLLAQRAQHHQRGWAVPPLESLGLTAVTAGQLVRHLAALTQQPLHALAVSDAACLAEDEAAELAAALVALSSLTSLSLGGTPPRASCCAMGGDMFAASSAACSARRGGLPYFTPAAPAPPAQAASGTCLPDLRLVAAATSLPALRQLELSLTFGRAMSEGQAGYLARLGAVLHRQRRQRELLHCGEDGSRVSIIVDEHVQGDLSAVPVASCSLNLDWDSDSNPIEVWQCSTLNELRISTQLPLQAGQFRPARLAALQVLHVAGCCHIPQYFAAALGSMQQLSRLELSDCLLEAVAAIPWQSVLSQLPALQALAIERCSGAVLLPHLWAGLAGSAHLRRLRITGTSTGGGLTPAAALGAGAGGRAQAGQGQPVPAAAMPSHAEHQAWLHACRQRQQQQQQVRVQQPQQQWQHAAAGGGATVPACVALMQQLCQLDLSNNGLHCLPDSLGWCQQLTDVRLAGNRLCMAPTSIAALGSLRKLDLSSNQLEVLGSGPYLQQLEELRLGGNLLLQPSGLPDQLLRHRRLRRVTLPAWWHLGGGPLGHAQSLLLHHLPWLALQHV